MSQKISVSVGLPDEIYEQYSSLRYGQKKLACAAGLLLYFGCDEDTQWAYREWVQAIMKGKATITKPPRRLRDVLKSTAKS